MNAALQSIAAPPRGSSLHFCSNSTCVFHVSAIDAGVEGFGDWAVLPDGTTVSHRWIEGQLLCDLCVAYKLRKFPRP